MAEISRRLKTVIVGAGPVGTLAALYAAVDGGDVELYELRSDLRDPDTIPLNFTKSINLALSERGINALRGLQRPELLQKVLAATTPMRGRMIHARDSTGSLCNDPQAYDVHGRAIFAIDRAHLNRLLLDELERFSNVRIHFAHKLTGADFERKRAWFEQRDPAQTHHAHKRAAEIEVSFDLIIGADGAHSSVRYHMMKYARVNYQQEYIDTLWCEFQISGLPELQGGGFRMSPNHLHIWPGGEFMFIAIPSVDHTFTCTLFLPYRLFSELSGAPGLLEEFFVRHFPGVVPDLIAPSALQSQFDDNPHLPLISIKCSPYHHNDSCVILGDAAHAMVPFYGQGMNAGFEDVQVLYELLRTHSTENGSKTRTCDEERASALQQYTAQRTMDGHTINDLALNNYIEMRSSVRSTLYRSRKWVEEHVDYWFPQLGWSTQYSRVSFSNQRYSDVEKAVRKQGRVLGG
ncbi:MAG: kynurenine 3-monooxygenase, mitochondrial precursor [Lichina confinis]|nr:MAG: kynurenine 3-monooxygenase, mitochondrial precursor [Lichina confinis]